MTKNRKLTVPVPYAQRHEQFLKAGKSLVKGDDYSQLSAAAVARKVGVSAPLVFTHFEGRDGLRDAVRKFIKSGDAGVKLPTVKAVKAPAKSAPKKPTVKAAKAPAKSAPKKPTVKAKKVAAKKVAVIPVAKFATPDAPSNVQ